MSKSEYAAEKLLALDNNKLYESLALLKKNLFQLRFQKALGESINSSNFGKVKKNIARINTELSQRNKQKK